MRLLNHKYCLAAIAILVFSPILSFAQKDTKIQFKAESMKNFMLNGQQIVRYIGNVNILHQGTTMTCDSAYLNNKTNSFRAFEHVIVTKEGVEAMINRCRAAIREGRLPTGGLAAEIGVAVKQSDREAAFGE